MYYSLHDYKQILKMQKERLFQTTITLPAANWRGVVDRNEEALQTVMKNISENNKYGITFNSYVECDQQPNEMQENVLYIVDINCIALTPDGIQTLEKLEEDAPYTQSVEILGVTPQSIVFAAPEPNMKNLSIASKYKILATGQGVNKIIFTAFEDRPETNYNVNEDEDVVINLVIGGEGRKDGGNIV